MLTYTTRFIITASLLLFAITPIVSGQNKTAHSINLDETGVLKIVEGKIRGDEIADYQVTGKQSQILSVDLLTSNLANYFNIMPAGSNEAIFIGSNGGLVADLALPASGTYVIRIYLMRSAARRGEVANYSMGISVGQPEIADSLSGGPEYWKVSGISGNSALSVREGPASRYKVISKLANGEVLENQGCRRTGSQRWCEVRAAHSGVAGWVAGRYLVESAAPPVPAMPEGGPVGNGGPFNATGHVPCVIVVGEPMRQCPFGVVRQGPGNAGVWIAVGDGTERHFLFEGGTPVATNSADPLEFEKTGDLVILRVGGERYEIPDAVINGG